jgi:hypothetical protein
LEQDDDQSNNLSVNEALDDAPVKEEQEQEAAVVPSARSPLRQRISEYFFQSSSAIEKAQELDAKRKEFYELAARRRELFEAGLVVPASGVIVSNSQPTTTIKEQPLLPQREPTPVVRKSTPTKDEIDQERKEFYALVERRRQELEASLKVREAIMATANPLPIQPMAHRPAETHQSQPLLSVSFLLVLALGMALSLYFEVDQVIWTLMQRVQWYAAPNKATKSF